MLGVHWLGCRGEADIDAVIQQMHVHVCSQLSILCQNSDGAFYAEVSHIHGDAGIMVSGCYSSTGEAYLWGANTNSQLGKGDASALPLCASCLSLHTFASLGLQPGNG